MIEKIKEYTTRDWLTVAVISAVIGVFFTLMDSMYTTLENLLGPIFMSLTFGIYALSALLPIYLTKKPGSALIGGLFAAVINILTGSPYGIHIIVAGFLQGFGAEVGFAATKYEKFRAVNFVFASVFITLFVTTRDYFVFGLSMLPGEILAASIALRFLSIVVISYPICLAVSTALQKAGLIKR